MSDEQPVLREQRGNVLVLTLNRPEARNALNAPLMGELGAGLAEAESNPDIRAVVITGTGDRAFCAGMDLGAFTSGGLSPTPEQQAGMATFNRFFSGQHIDVPIVGAAQSSAVAGGFEVLLNCDLAVVADDAKLGLPEVKRGLFAAGGGVFLGQRIPMAIALELCLTGDYITPDRAAHFGLVNRVVPAADVLDTAIGLAEAIAANGPLGLAASKEIVKLAVVDHEGARKRQAELQPKVFGSEDAREGSLAFMEKRSPVWKGQ